MLIDSAGVASLRGGASSRARRVRERARFARSFLRNPRLVGAMVPTSQRAVCAMLDLVALDGARCVVEMGAGTGTHTRELLARLPAGARLLAFEIDPILADGLDRELCDSRLQVINESAERIGEWLGGDQADVIVSAVPYTSLSREVRHGLLDAARDGLADDGTMLVLQYSPFVRAQLAERFASVDQSVVLRNAPPAFMFACRPA